MERVERNVLPVLNNLLENREAQLEDGRFLMAPSRWDQLAKSSSIDEMNKAGLVRVDEFFRVIALGLPVPLFRGAPLDPPLRSRFQARQVSHKTSVTGHVTHILIRLNTLHIMTCVMHVWKVQRTKR